jgi:hypothetical protein
MAVPAKWKACLPAEEYAKYESEYERLRNAGRTDTEAKAETIAKYGPVTGKPLLTPSLPPADTKDRPALRVKREDFDWVYANMYAKGVTPESAPSHGAFALWDMCQDPKGRQVFFDKFFPKIARETLDQQDDAHLDDEKQLNDLIDKVMKIAEECSPSS